MTTIGDLNQYFKDLEDMASRLIAESFTRDIKRFTKEITQTSSVTITDHQLYPLALDDAETQGTDWMEHLTGLHLLTHHNLTYLILGAPRSRYQRIVEWSVLNQKMRTIARFQLSSVSLDKVNKIAAKVYDGSLFLALGSSGSRLVSVVCVNLITGQIRMPHTIPSRGVVGALHMFQFQGQLYLVIGESFYTRPGDGLCHSAIYALDGEYFDLRENLKLSAAGVNDIATFALGSATYIVLGMKSPGGSLVYELRTGILETVREFQTLKKETNAIRVEHFKDQYDEKHYVVVLTAGKTLVIYWWIEKGLRVLHTLTSQETVGVGSSLGAIQLYNYDSLLLASFGESIVVYTYDQNKYDLILVHPTTCRAVRDLQGISLENKVWLLYVCEESVNRLEAVIINLDELVEDKFPGTDDELILCLRDLHNTLNGRKGDTAYLKEVVESDILMTNDHSQVWTGPVQFTNLWVAESSSLDHTVVIPPPEFGSSNQTLVYEELVTRIQGEVSVVQGKLGDLLYYTGSQTIHNPVLAVGLSVNTASFNSLLINQLNGLPIRSLVQELLLDGPDQTISGQWHLRLLSATTVSTRRSHPPGTVAGLFTSDYMRRSVQDQIVVGSHAYNSLAAGQICHSLCSNNLAIEINGIDTSTIVIKGSDVSFTSSKTFNILIIQENLRVDTINKVSVGEVFRNAVFTDLVSVQTLSGHYTVSLLKVAGNLASASVNGFDIAKLEREVVKKHGDYRLAGSLVYKRDLLVRGSTNAEAVNGVRLEDFLLRHSPGSVAGTYTFTQATVTASLQSERINGIDLSREAVLIDLDQSIGGRLSLVQSVRVTGPTGVQLGEGIALNNVDPSELTVGGVSGGVLVVDQEITFNSALLVSGNITSFRINGVDVATLLTGYWRKSGFQEIKTSVHIQNAIFLGSVKGGTLNGRKIEEYLNTDHPQTITGHYTFKGRVVVNGNVVVADGSNLDGVDVAALASSVVTLDGSQTIETNLTFAGTVTVKGELDIRAGVTGLEVLSDAMRLDQSLSHTGRLNFVGGAIVNSLKMTSSLRVELINGLNLQAAAADLVLVDQDATIRGGGGLRFTGAVHVREARVQGLVDGVEVNNLVSRALRTSSVSSQHITGLITVDGNVKFAQGPKLSTVNGELWKTYLGNVVPSGYSGRLTGKKVFTRALHIQGNLQVTKLNSVSVGVLASVILRKSLQQSVSAHYTFTSDLQAEDLFAPVIDGVPTDKIVLVDEPSSLEGTVSFTEDFSLLAGLMATSNVLDGCDLGQVVSQPSTQGTEERVIITSGIEISTLIIDGQATISPLATGVAGALLLQDFLGSLVLKSTNQIITGTVKFSSDVHMKELEAVFLDGVNVDNFFRQTVRRDEDVTIDCDLVLTKGLQVGRLEVTSLAGVGESVAVNMIKLSDLYAQAVLRDAGSYVVSGRKIFERGLSVQHLLARSIGGVAVGDLVTVGEARLLPHLVFRAPITVLGNLQVSGLLDGVDLELLISTRVRVDLPQVLSADYRFQSIRVEGDLIAGSINQVTLADLVLKSGREIQIVSGAKAFLGGLHVNGDIMLGQLNGVDFAELNRTVVRLATGATTINVQLTFEQVVTCLGRTEVRGGVNGHDLSELGRSLSQIQHRLDQQSKKINFLLGQFGSLNEENYVKARELYAELSSLERVFLPQDTDVYGKLWVGTIPGYGNETLMKITTCHVLICGCEVECHFFKVGRDTRLTKVSELGHRVDTVNYPLPHNHYVLLHSECVEGTRPEVKVTLVRGPNTALATFQLQGILVDSKIFVLDGSGYLVIVAAGPDGKVILKVLHLDTTGRTITTVWQRDGNKQTAAIDLAYVDGLWYLLLANAYGGGSLEHFTTDSELLFWDASSREFRLVGEYFGYQVASGHFWEVMGETFFTLTQFSSLPHSKHTHHHACNSNVLVYRYNKDTKEFEAFQSLAAFNVLDQTSLTVHNSFYLLLVSPVDQRLYICLYKHAEGFVILYDIFVKSPRSVVTVKGDGGTFVLVSTMEGLVRFQVYVKGVDPNTLLLY